MLVDMSGTDLDFIEKLLAKNYRFNGRYSPVEDNKKWLDGLRSRYPGMTFAHEDMVVEGDKVAMRWRLNIPNFMGKGKGCIRGTNIITFDTNHRIASINQDDLSGKHHFFPDSGGVIDIP